MEIHTFQKSFHNVKQGICEEISLMFDNKAEKNQFNYIG